jgi:hypothetical protein
MAEVRVTIRLSAEQAARLDSLAEEAATTRVAVLRRLIDGADGVGEDTIEPLDAQGVLGLLSESARRGSVNAAKVLLDHQRQVERERAADEELERLRVVAQG